MQRWSIVMLKKKYLSEIHISMGHPVFYLGTQRLIISNGQAKREQCTEVRREAEKSKLRHQMCIEGRDVCHSHCLPSPDVLNNCQSASNDSPGKSGTPLPLVSAS